MATNLKSKVRGKNQTPNQLAFYGALVSAFFYAGILACLEAVQLVNLTTTAMVIMIVAAIVIDYLANYYFIRFYIYRRIKVIYKLIHRQKGSQEYKESDVQMRRAVLDEVEEDTEAWVASHETEMAELERMAAYRRLYLGNVSHELKTPIFSIQGYLHTLIDGGIDDETIRDKYLLRAAKNTDRLLTIVRDLELINKLDDGSEAPEMTYFEIKELCTEVFEELEIKAEERNITLTFKPSASDQWMVYADRERIRQVLVNLIYNSVKYGIQDGTTKLSFYDMETYLLVEVADNGIGIGEEHLNHVFDRFYRIDKSRSRDAGGTGLGLAIVKHIIEAHGQTITVRSSEGQGSTFGFTLRK